MEYATCDICAVQLKSGASNFERINGKVCCPKCAQLHKRALDSTAPTGDFAPVAAPPPAANPNVTKFYFCETCNKRITDQQILDGLGRDKKLKGIYCKECAVGVMTMEFDAIQESDLRKPMRKSSGNAVPAIRETPASASKTGIAAAKRTEVRPQKTATHVRPSTEADVKPIAIAMAAAVALAVIGTLVLSSGSPAVKTSAAKVDRTPETVQLVEKFTPSSPPAKPATKPVPVDDGAADVNKAVPKDPVPAPPIATAPADPEPPVKPAEPETAEKPVAPEVPALKVVDDAPEPGVKIAPGKPRAIADEAAAQKQYSDVRKELEPLLKRNQFSDADRLLDEKMRNPANADIQSQLSREKSDLVEIQAFRARAMAALREKAGTAVALKKGTMNGVVKVDPNKEGVSIALKDGPELNLTVAQLDTDDVNALVPAVAGGGSGDDLRCRGILYLAAGDSVKAADYFAKARDAGLGAALDPYLGLLAAQKRSGKEAAALDAWKKAEAQFAGKNWKPARLAYEAFQRDYAGTAALAGNADALKSRLEAIDEAIASSEDHVFDFDTPANFADFCKLFNGPSENGVDLKYEPKKALIHAPPSKNGPGQLLSPALKLGPTWEIHFRFNLKPIKNFKIVPFNLAIITLQFLQPADIGAKKIQAQALAVAYNRLEMVPCTWNGGVFDGGLRGPGPAQFENQTGIFAGVGNNSWHFANPTWERTYDVKYSLQGDQFKAVIDGNQVIDTKFPAATLEFIRNSPLVLYFENNSGNDLELLHFSYRRRVTVLPSPKK